MEPCKLSPEVLMAWVDGEVAHLPEKLRHRLPDHVEQCAQCQEQLEELDAFKQTGPLLREAIESTVGELDALQGLHNIRQKIAEGKERGLAARVRAMVADIWAFHRGAIAGVMVAAALGALSAPGVLWWVSKLSGHQESPLAAAVVESVEVGGDTRAVVYRPEDSSTTLIWVEPYGAIEDEDVGHEHRGNLKDPGFVENEPRDL